MVFSSFGFHIFSHHENQQITLMNRFFFKSKARVAFLFFCVVLISTGLFIYFGYKAAENPVSYLPQIDSMVANSASTDLNPIVIKNPAYQLQIDHTGKISVRTNDGELIVSSLTYYSKSDKDKGNWGLGNVDVRILNDSSTEINGTTPNSIVKLVLICSKYLPKIDVKIETRYGANTILKREALVAAFAIPVSEVYTKNRKVDRDNFEAEYWLQKEGVRFGTNERSALIYHTPSVSSLQLETEKRLLFINLDYSLDHPFIRLPYQKDEGKRWVDLSEADYAIGSVRTNSFSINFGENPKTTPRLMLVPNGYKAGYVFTEHADGGDIRKQRAAYFGSEDITNAAKATGGFVGHKIPVTKSVFYTGPETAPGASIYEGEKISPLLNFLDQLHATGLYDLCLHTPENLSSTRETLETSIKFMKERYNTASWIDHGFYGGKINREAMVCDGLDSTSQFYAADIWKKYDTRYFWSPAVEMIDNANWVSVSDNIKRLKFYKAYVTLLQHYLSPKDLQQLSLFQAARELKKRHSYRTELNTLEYNSGNSRPTPLYWLHPTRTQQFYSWATNEEKYYSDDDAKEEKEQLRNLINNQGIYINHGYFARNLAPVDKVLKSVNGKLVISPNFDKILSMMDGMRNDGDLYITTIADLMDYWIMLEKVTFEYLPGGAINVINGNKKAIKGLSIIMRAKDIRINGKIPSTKNVRDDTIFWFDIGPQQTVQLEVK